MQWSSFAVIFLQRKIKQRLLSFPIKQARSWVRLSINLNISFSLWFDYGLPLKGINLRHGWKSSRCGTFLGLLVVPAVPNNKTHSTQHYSLVNILLTTERIHKRFNNSSSSLPRTNHVMRETSQDNPSMWSVSLKGFSTSSIAGWIIFLNHQKLVALCLWSSSIK